MVGAKLIPKYGIDWSAHIKGKVLVNTCWVFKGVWRFRINNLVQFSLYQETSAYWFRIECMVGRDWVGLVTIKIKPLLSVSSTTLSESVRRQLRQGLLLRNWHLVTWHVSHFTPDEPLHFYEWSQPHTSCGPFSFLAKPPDIQDARRIPLRPCLPCSSTIPSHHGWAVC